MNPPLNPFQAAAGQVGNLSQLRPMNASMLSTPPPQIGQLGLPINFGGAPSLMGPMDATPLMMPRSTVGGGPDALLQSTAGHHAEEPRSHPRAQKGSHQSSLIGSVRREIQQPL